MSSHAQVLAELAPENAESFGNEVQSILSGELCCHCGTLLHFTDSSPAAHSSAQKLMSIPGSLGPVWPVLNCVLKEGAKRKDDTQKTVVVAVRSLAAVLCVDVCQLLQPAVNEMAEDVCRVCHIHLPYSSSQTLSLSLPFYSNSPLSQTSQNRPNACSVVSSGSYS